MSWSVPHSPFLISVYCDCFLHFDFSSLSCPLLFSIPSKVLFAVLLMYVLKKLGRQFSLLATFRHLPMPSFSFLPPQLVRELLHENQAISVGVSAESGGQWLSRIRQLIKEGSVPDVCLVPVGISYDCVPKSDVQVDMCKHTLRKRHL